MRTVYKEGGGCNMNWLIVFFIVFLVIAPTVFDVSDYRVALAEDIKSGHLVLTPKAKSFIDKGDEFLNVDYGDVKYNDGRYHKKVYEDSLYSAFVAKVFFERARLEMEIRNDCQGQ